ncbi:hypothetical protein AX14_009416 [Amanita brunnescens Koide BX004]|nr:hypothetical protein AX14_009416 [Amanita brunnescens Koide BX004]
MGKQELLIGAVNVECSDEHPPYCEAPVLPVPVDPDPSNGANAKWPSQEAISNIEMSMLLRSPESPAVLTLPTLADPLPAYALPRSSLELKSWLRWKPPDHGESPRWHAYHAVNVRIRPNTIKHSCPPGAALTLSMSRSLLAYTMRAVPSRCQNLPLGWCVSIPPAGVETVRRHAVSIVSHNADASAEGRSPMSTVRFMPPIHHRTSAWAKPPRLPNVELVWQAHCKLPNATHTVQWHSAGVVSARNDTSIKRSPLHGIVLMLPVFLFASLARVISPCRLNNELVHRVRKPPDTAGHRLLEEAINKIRSTRPLSTPTRTASGPLSPPYPAITSARRSSSCEPTERTGLEPPVQILQICIL